MNIVVLDGYCLNPEDLSWAELEACGTVQVYPRTDITNVEEIVGHIGDAEMVFTNKTPISEEIFLRCPQVKFIGALATGYNVIDCVAAKKADVVVCNVPTYGTASVGQFAIALLLEICHHVAHHDAAVKEGRWEHNQHWCFWDYPLIELAGKTMGIIGFGRIGQTTGKIAQAMGMDILAHDSYPSATGEAIGTYVDLDTLLAQSDVIALHCPLLPETEHIINAKTIGKMKDGVIILNNSRGQLIAQQDLADALNSGKVYGAGLDVVETEPIKGDNPLLTAKNCIITPHISWAAKESRQRIMDCSVANARGFMAGKPINVVNP